MRPGLGTSMLGAGARRSGGRPGLPLGMVEVEANVNLILPWREKETQKREKISYGPTCRFHVLEEVIDDLMRYLSNNPKKILGHLVISLLEEIYQGDAGDAPLVVFEIAYKRFNYNYSITRLFYS